jgi:hypothetical protein
MFYQAAEASKHLSFFHSGYDLNGVSPEQVATLIQKNFEYCIVEMTKDAKHAKGKGQMTLHPPHSGSSRNSMEDGKLQEANKQQYLLMQMFIVFWLFFSFLRGAMRLP